MNFICFLAIWKRTLFCNMVVYGLISVFLTIIYFLRNVFLQDVLSYQNITVPELGSLSRDFLACQDRQRKKENFQSLTVRTLKAVPLSTGLAFALTRSLLQEVPLGQGAPFPEAT